MSNLWGSSASPEEPEGLDPIEEIDRLRVDLRRLYSLELIQLAHGPRVLFLELAACVMMFVVKSSSLIFCNQFSGEFTSSFVSGNTRGPEGHSPLFGFLSLCFSRFTEAE